METKAISSVNLSKILKKTHQNKWVALSADYKKLLAVGKDLSSVLKKTSQTEKKVVFRVLPNLLYAPAAF